MARAIVTVLAAALAAGSAAAQSGRDSIHFTPTPEGTRVTVTSAGKTLPVWNATESGASGFLRDMDGDGRPDAVIRELLDDGNILSVRLRRGDRFVEAGRREEFYEGTLFRDLDRNGTIEILMPGPSAGNLLKAFSLEGPHGFPDPDTISFLRYKKDRYVPERIECEPELRASYLAAIKLIDSFVFRFEKGEGAVFEGRTVDSRDVPRVKLQTAWWRERLSAGCQTKPQS